MGIWLIFIKLALITAVAVFFSSLSTPILSGMFTLAFYIIGNTSFYLTQLVDPANNPVLATFLRLLTFVLPDFSYLDIKAQIVYQQPIEAAYVLHATGYALFYLMTVLSLSALIFDRKDMK